MAAHTTSRNAGEWLRERLLNRAVRGGLLTLCGIGWLFGGLLSAVLDVPVWMVLGTAVAFLTVGSWYLFRGWRLEDVKKGARAEEKVGEAIEYALMRNTCAVAHGVTEIAEVGDIDHLVATPRGLWVVETKSGGSARRHLKRIVKNVNAVRDWAPPGVDVTGVLAFTGDLPVKTQNSYERGAETILCFRDAQALTRRLLIEAGAAVSLDSGVVRDVWKLGNRPVDDRLISEPAGRQTDHGVPGLTLEHTRPG